MTEGKIVEWLKKPGDKVGRGESVLVVESDKADMDVESFNEGYLAAVLMPAGSTAPVGETIGLIVETEAEFAEAQAKGLLQSQLQMKGEYVSAYLSTNFIIFAFSCHEALCEVALDGSTLCC